MKEITVLLLISTIVSSVKEIHGAKVWGPRVNISDLFLKIWLKGTKELVPNMLPDMTYNDKTRQRWPGADAAVGRRFLKDILSDQRKHIWGNADKELFNDDAHTVLTLGNSEVSGSSLAYLKDIKPRILTDLGLSGRRQTELHLHHHRDTQKTLLKSQHERKLKEIKIFLDSNYLSTDYIYDEVQRIKKHHVIKDPLRNMVDYLSRPGMDDLINSVFQCFQERRKLDVSPTYLWKNRVPNNLVINTLKDPQNDGFIN